MEDYLRLLKEAQESNQSSARVSLAGSRRDSPRSSPKSPPNSPVQGTALNLEWQSYYINSEAKEVRIHLVQYLVNLRPMVSTSHKYKKIYKIFLEHILTYMVGTVIRGEIIKFVGNVKY